MNKWDKCSGYSETHLIICCLCWDIVLPFLDNSNITVATLCCFLDHSNITLATLINLNINSLLSSNLEAFSCFCKLPAVRVYLPHLQQAAKLPSYQIQLSYSIFTEFFAEFTELRVLMIYFLSIVGFGRYLVSCISSSYFKLKYNLK